MPFNSINSIKLIKYNKIKKNIQNIKKIVKILLFLKQKALSKQLKSTEKVLVKELIMEIPPFLN